jgi:hypothetical protein
VNRKEIDAFANACFDNGINFSQVQGGVSIEDNVRLIRESYMAPAIVGSGHPVGYLPCRIFKNISYGQFGVTNSSYVNDLFEGRLVYNSDTYGLFLDARERLAKTPLSELHSLMDYVAKNHTYINRIDTLIHGARMILER